MTSEPQDRNVETDQPNEFGFAGGATAPEPERTSESRLHDEVEAIAVPSGDITGAITEAIDEVTDHEDRDRH
ncbi:hypothetical protein AMIS_74940 [Actinoplanes missouriensis 431]|uniref:Uncharacterized protein n=1 Tax=Actinoplanes missouriensis (strain ATCC 14538 / DSM 43046 / CBS 188.64 / JCM 3121 / NBRC 102363 / NCIMB 12654 / NRRL B-3342 / UNCC 431) TaxID=512565 RepID=I0HI77_ACTM4|nr:hypothetical protein [Actinoplanes missouriensis]BAL92714.1 hypothetical protein AMIS_74940 [Actinoplanes missouriensis 431]